MRPRRSALFANRLMRLQRAATVVEYGLVAALIAIAAVTAMTSFGVNLGAAFHNSSTNQTVI